jgi:nicotinate phosphoribosyltransferase
MGVSGDAPWLDIAYKLVEYAGHPVLKLSPGKISWPGKKQAFRQRDSQGQLQRDIIGLRDENLPGIEPLLHKVMNRGKVVQPQPTLDDSRTALGQEFACLPEPAKAIHNPSSYPVEFTPKLSALLEQIEQEITQSNND